MKLYRLRRVQNLSIPMEDAWRFFSSPLNLPTITPPWMKFRNTGEIPDNMFPGMLIRYRLTPIFGIPISWITEITHVDPPHSFVDEQRFGPYRFWHHHHLFRPAAEGTEMIDTVHYRLKYGILGGLLHRVFIQKRLKEIFDFRRVTLEQIFNEDECMKRFQGGRIKPPDGPAAFRNDNC